MFNKNICLIRDFIKQLVELEERYFYPKTVNRLLGIPLDVVAVELNKLVEDGIIKLMYHMDCPSLHDVAETEDFEAVLGSIATCNQCDAYVSKNYSCVFPKYYITEEYIAYVTAKQSL